MSTPAFVLAQRRSLFWRIHFWAALVASPFAVVAALTGLLYVATPQVEAVLYSHLDNVVPAGQRRPLDELVQAARNAAPQGMNLRTVIVPARADQSVQVVFTPARGAPASPAGHAGHGDHGASAAPAGHEAHAGHDAHAQHATAPAPQPAAPAPSQWGERLPRGPVVYVNPYTAQVLGSHPEMDRFNVWARRLHSSLLQSDGWRWMIELAASWLMVMLLTGVYLWWPRGAAARVLPVRGARGRVWWKQWHAFAGVALSVMSLAILTTGLTWSRYAGDQIRAARDAIGQAPPSAPRGLQSIVTGEKPLSWEEVLQNARSQVPEVAIQILPPHGAQGVWRLNNQDRGQATGRFSLVLDAYSGRTLFLAGWDRQTAFSKLTAIGIPFHRGEFGWWNQLLLFAFGAGVLFSLVSGWVMFFKRRAQGVAMLPRLLPGAWTSLPTLGWVAAVLLLVLMPLLAASAPLVALAEVLLHRRRAGHFAVIHG